MHEQVYAGMVLRAVLGSCKYAKRPAKVVIGAGRYARADMGAAVRMDGAHNVGVEPPEARGDPAIGSRTMLSIE